MIDVSIVNRTAPALTRNRLGKPFNRTAPALTRDTVRNVNLGKRVEADGRGPNRPGPPAANPTPGGAPIATPASPSLEKARPAAPGPARPEDGPGRRRRQSDAAAGGLWLERPGCPVRHRRVRLPALRGSAGALDEWFVFYGQPVSPDGAVRFSEDGREDREIISLDLGRLSPEIQRVVFVMTIDEAAAHGLNFGMIQEAWMRITDSSGRELVGYSPSELFENVTSMTLGELYLRNGEWRFNPVGNGVNTDLAGQCAVYGVQISG